MRKFGAIITSLLTFCGLSSQSLASGWSLDTTRDALNATFSLSQLHGKSRTYTFADTGRKTSQITWGLDNITVLNAGIEWQAAPRLEFYADAGLGFNGAHSMDYYRWVNVRAPATPDDVWQADNAKLDHHFSLDAGTRFSFIQWGEHKLFALGGVQYISTQLTASGGCNVGVSNAGCLADNAKLFTHEINMPAVYTGLGFETHYQDWSFHLHGRIGQSFDTRGNTTNYITKIDHKDFLVSAPYYGAKLEIDYAMTDKVHLQLTVAYDEIMSAHGKTHYTDRSTGAKSASSFDAGGSNYKTAELGLGIKIDF